jgi:hypothetical protein
MAKHIILRCPKCRMRFITPADAADGNRCINCVPASNRRPADATLRGLPACGAASAFAAKP